MALTAQEVKILLTAQDQASAALGKVEGSLGKLEGSAAKTGSALGTFGKVLGGVAVAGLAGLAVGLAKSVSAAADFENQLAGIKAVSGATASEMEQISAVALQIGKDTSFGAAEAATGIEELIKAGVSVEQVVAGAAKGTAALAEAAGTDLKTAAEIASNALNTFNISGAEMGHVADVIAGATNASAIDINDFKFSMSAAGAVANAVGLSFDDAATAIAVLGQAGLKGSDAGTSLKTMLLNLQPSTKKQTQLFRELGLITADGANQFFDATGKIKSMAEVSQVLQNALSGMTEQQKLATLEMIFGSDAIRAGVIFSKAGAEGFEKMADAMSKVTAADVARERLNSLTGSLKSFWGSVETAAIIIGSALTPALKSIVDGATGMVNRATPALESFAKKVSETIPQISGAFSELGKIFAGEDVVAVNVATLMDKLGLVEFVPEVRKVVARAGEAWRTIGQVFGEGWEPDATIDPVVNAIGRIAIAVRDTATRVQEEAPKYAAAFQQMANDAAPIIDSMVVKVGELATQVNTTMTDINTNGTKQYNDFWLGANGVTVQQTQTQGQTIANWGQNIQTTLTTISQNGNLIWSDFWTILSGLTNTNAPVVVNAIDVMSRNIGIAIARINTEGGAEYNKFWMDAQGTTTTGTSAVVEKFQTMSTQAVAALNTMSNQMATALNTAWDQMVASVQGLAGRIVSELENVGRQAREAANRIGAGIGEGIADGIRRTWSMITGASAGAVDTALTAAQGAADVQSPSKLFADKVGVPMGEGIVEGFVRAVGAGKADMAEAVRAIATTVLKAGLPPAAIKDYLALALTESGLRPGAVGDSGASVGLFQLHAAGMGAGMGESRKDPWVNAQKFISSTAELWKQLRGGVDGARASIEEFGGRAEVSAREFWHRYGTALRQVESMFGGVSLSAKTTADALDAQTAATGPATSGLASLKLEAGGLWQQVADGVLNWRELGGELVDASNKAGLTTISLEGLTNNSATMNLGLAEMVSQLATVSPEFAALDAQLTANNATGEKFAQTFVSMFSGVMTTTSPQVQALRLHMVDLHDAVQNGNINFEQFVLLLARAATDIGLTDAPLQGLESGVLTADQAFLTVLNTLAEADPQFAALRDQFKNTGIDSMTLANTIVNTIPKATETAGTAMTTMATTTGTAGTDMVTAIQTAAKDIVAAINTGMDRLVAIVEQAVGKVGQLIAKIPTKVDMAINVDTEDVDDATKSVQKLGKALDKLDIEDADFSKDTGIDKLFGSFQHGGYAPAGMPIWVGEQGRELFWPGQGGYVMPHGMSEQLAGAGAQPITINAYGGDSREVAREALRLLRQQQLLGGI